MVPLGPDATLLPAPDPPPGATPELREVDVPHEGALEPLELPFDQHDRYRLVADLCRAFARPGETLRVLDVGGRTGILRRFLPEARVDLVDVELADTAGLVLGDGTRLPVRHGAVDVVCAADTLEHVPPDRRAAFVRECCRAARRAVVLAGPYAHPDVDEAEQLLSDFLWAKLSLQHRYLAEHRANGLPVRADVERWCSDSGARAVASYGRGNLDRWLGTISLSMYLDHHPRMRGVARRLYRFLNRAVLDSDPRGTVYRHGVVAVFDGSPLPTAEEVAAPPLRDIDRELAATLSHVGRELLAFDQQRDVFDAECRRLESVVQSLGRDLEGHREVLRRQSEELVQHRAVLQDRERLLDETRQVLTEVREDLERHRAALRAEREERSAERARHAEVEDELRVQLAQHRAHARDLAQELGAVRAEARAIQDELLRKTRWRRKLWALLGRR